MPHPWTQVFLLLLHDLEPGVCFLHIMYVFSHLCLHNNTASCEFAGLACTDIENCIGIEEPPAGIDDPATGIDIDIDAPAGIEDPATGIDDPAAGIDIDIDAPTAIDDPATDIDPLGDPAC